VSQDQLNIALTEQKRFKAPLGKVLVMLGFVTEATIRDILSETLGQVSIDLDSTIIDPAAIAIVPKDLARRYHVLPVSYDAERELLLLAVADPANVVAMDQIRALSREELRIEQVIARESDITLGIEHNYGFELSIDGILNEIETGEIDYQSLAHDFDEYSQPVVRLVDALLNDAVKRSASDIHFEPEQGSCASATASTACCARSAACTRTTGRRWWCALKVMCGMNIAETRAPQDGRISLTLSGPPRRLPRLVAAHDARREHRAAHPRPRQGHRAARGPGAARRTTEDAEAHARAARGNHPRHRAHGQRQDHDALFDPQLHQYRGHQHHDPRGSGGIPDGDAAPDLGDEVVKLDFASGIRSMMRQDPDVILVGEVRDQETAEMAFRAAMTGHQVYSTLHTNSSIGAIPRLTDLGVLPDIMAGNIIGVIAQRLVRKLCAHCKAPYTPDASTLHLLGVEGSEERTIFQAAGCARCDQVGYRGRMAIMELFKLDAEIDELIARRATGREIKTAAAARGFRTLADDAIARVLDGQTSLEEISRVVDLTDRVA
jgi:type II secretory ATPase GspE/PulE/Tfp pilus assembly ATPase PilB-like protein